MLDLVKQSLLSQFEASLAMLHHCVVKCPDALWDAPIAKYPYWMVTYHTLCFVDCYLSHGNAAFVLRQGEGQGGVAGGGGLHPKGFAELDEEYPSRRFAQSEMVEYCAICLEKARAMISADTEATLRGPAGFDWLSFSRLELHLYNLRHIMHHTGQLNAALRRGGVDGRWVGKGWKE